MNKGSGSSRKNCFSKPATLFTSWKKFSGLVKSTLEESGRKVSLNINLQRHSQHTIIESCLHMVDMVGASRLSVNTLHIQTKHLNCLDTLINNHWDCGPISAEQIFQSQAKHRSNRRKVVQKAIRWLHHRCVGGSLVERLGWTRWVRSRHRSWW